MPIVVCSALRFVCVMTPSPPRRFTSSNAAAYSLLFRAGGGGARNWSADCRTNGLTSPQKAPRASGIRLIGSWRHLPGSLLVMYSKPTRGSGWWAPWSALGALFAVAPDPAEVFVEPLVEARPLRGEEGDQRIVRRLCDRGVHGGVIVCGGKAGKALVAAVDRVHRIEDRDVDDRQRPARSAGPPLLPEHPLP